MKFSLKMFIIIQIIHGASCQSEIIHYDDSIDPDASISDVLDLLEKIPKVPPPTIKPKIDIMLVLVLVATGFCVVCLIVKIIQCGLYFRKVQKIRLTSVDTEMIYVNV